MDDPKQRPQIPSASADEDDASAGNSLSVVRGGISSPMAFNATPIYRVLEVFRDTNGRLRKEGRVWHTDLNRMRKFGRAVASNTASLKVLITDAVGDVMEEIPPASADNRQPRWGSWENIPLPPCPPKARKKPKPRPEPLPPPPSGTFPALNVEAVQTALNSAAPAADPTVAENDTPTTHPAQTTPAGDLAASPTPASSAPPEPPRLMPAAESPLVGDFGSEASLL